AGEKVEERMSQFHQVVEARYIGQNFEVGVAIEANEEIDFDTFVARFTQAHDAEYGYAIPGRAIEVVNCRVKAVGLVPKPYNAFTPDADASAENALIETRAVCYDARMPRVDTPVYKRLKLPVGTIFEGPAIIEEMSSTTMIPPETRFRVDAGGNIIISNIKVSQ